MSAVLELETLRLTSFPGKIETAFHTPDSIGLNYAVHSLEEIDPYAKPPSRNGHHKIVPIDAVSAEMATYSRRTRGRVFIPKPNGEGFQLKPHKHLNCEDGVANARKIQREMAHFIPWRLRHIPSIENGQDAEKTWSEMEKAAQEDIAWEEKDIKLSSYLHLKLDEKPWWKFEPDDGEEDGRDEYEVEILSSELKSRVEFKHGEQNLGTGDKDSGELRLDDFVKYGRRVRKPHKHHRGEEAVARDRHTDRFTFKYETVLRSGEVREVNQAPLVPRWNLRIPSITEDFQDDSHLPKIGALVSWRKLEAFMEADHLDSEISVDGTPAKISIAAHVYENKRRFLAEQASNSPLAIGQLRSVRKAALFPETR